MDTLGFIFGSTGMTFGLMGFVFGMNASHVAKSLADRVDQLEQQFSKD